jgi:hypothetical protein
MASVVDSFILDFRDDFKEFNLDQCLKDIEEFFGVNEEEQLAKKRRPSPPRYTTDEILEYPYKQIELFNAGNLNGLFKLIDQHFVVDCQIDTPFSSQSMVGRDVFKDMHVAILEDRPDTVYTVKYTKLVRNKVTEERFLIAKMEFHQTRASYQHDVLDKLDEVYRPEELNQLKADPTVEERQRYFVDRKIPYSASGYKWLRFKLNELNEICGVHISRKFLSVEEFNPSAAASAGASSAHN